MVSSVVCVSDVSALVSQLTDSQQAAAFPRRAILGSVGHSDPEAVETLLKPFLVPKDPSLMCLLRRPSFQPDFLSMPRVDPRAPCIVVPSASVSRVVLSPSRSVVSIQKVFYTHYDSKSDRVLLARSGGLLFRCSACSGKRDADDS